MPTRGTSCGLSSIAVCRCDVGWWNLKQVRSDVVSLAETGKVLSIAERFAHVQPSLKTMPQLDGHDSTVAPLRFSSLLAWIFGGNMLHIAKRWLLWSRHPEFSNKRQVCKGIMVAWWCVIITALQLEPCLAGAISHLGGKLVAISVTPSYPVCKLAVWLLLSSYSRNNEASPTVSCPIAGQANQIDLEQGLPDRWLCLYARISGAAVTLFDDIATGMHSDGINHINSAYPQNVSRLDLTGDSTWSDTSLF